MRLAGIGLALVVVCAPVAQAQGAKQFSIVCPTEPAGSTQVFQVDLDRRLWCKTLCETPQPIVVATENELWLAGAHTPGKSTDTIVNVYRVDRANGTIFMQSFGYDVAVYKNCSGGPFGGISQNRF